MDDVISETYTFMAESNDAELSPVGTVWRYLKENHPDIHLYSSDGSHPSLAGSYAAATAFYTMIYKKNPTEITWDASLNENQADIIKWLPKQSFLMNYRTGILPNIQLQIIQQL